MSAPAQLTKGQPPSASGSSPVKAKLQGTTHYAAKTETALERHGQMSKEMSGKWVGPMEPRKFLKRFLPSKPNGPKRPSFSTRTFNTPRIIGKERDLYEPFISLITKSHAIPGMDMIDTSANPDKTSAKSKKLPPDICIYDQEADIPQNTLRYDAVEMIVEVKPWDNKSDPFRDPVSDDTDNFSFESQTVKGAYCRGQIASYATQWAARQHRTHLFVIWIGVPFCRFIRIDRSGGIVSERFNIQTNGTILLDFFWRFSQLSPAERGHDTTVRPATDTEIALAHEHLMQWQPSEERKVMVLQVPDGDDMRDVIAWGAMAEPESLTGRATKGYPVWDTKDKKVVFLKDSWRSIEPGMQKESEILAILNEKGVRNIPKFVCGDDLNQETITHTFTSEPWNLGAKPNTLDVRMHTRFCEDFIGIHLHRFKSSKQFITVVLDALIAHHDAYVKAGFLHRDISAKNIMMTPDGRGILNDWDLARAVEDIKNGARQKFRSGTWQFMSVGLLEDPTKLHELPDDLESFVYIILYFTLRYLDHNRFDNLGMIMDYIFDYSNSNDDGTVTGGAGKARVASSRNPIGEDFAVTDNAPLTELLDFSLEAVREWHNICIDRRRPNARKPKFTPTFSSHDEMMSEIAAQLAKDDWPKGDAAFDYLGLKRKLDNGGTPVEEGSFKKVKLDSEASSEETVSQPIEVASLTRVDELRGRKIRPLSRIRSLHP
ncbi:unnamed protein product [Cyclocybe aegerita]|uniref:Fungal-type protein kinase domain-containing protein n=1 Tax=Cyclocybe aegerita TaxID=1973307 RepID=A0A8S0W6Q0_CYCAE|nr:unnamed protein product [Cyclocybe aegerita]